MEAFMCMALCPIRSGKRLRNNDSMNSLLVLSNNDDVILGRQQLLPCLYSACGCDDNIGSTQNKCGACQLTNEWAIQALSRKLLLFSKSGKLYGRGKHASILVNSKPLLFNVEGKGEWQGGEEIQAGSLLSLMPVEGEGILEFEIVSIDSATNEIMEKLVEDSAENHHPILSPSPMKTQEFHLDKGMRFQDDTDNSDNFMGGEEPPGPSSECMTSRTYHYDDIACQLESRNCLSDPSVSCGELLSNSVDSDSSLKRADLPIPRFAFRESNTQEISIRETQTEIGLDPAAIDNSESKARAGEDIIEKRDSNTQVISNINASGHQDAMENQTESCPESAIDYLKSKEKVEKVMTKSLESRGLVLFFCPLGQDLPEKRRKLLSEKAVSLGATVTDSFLSATHLIVSEHTSSLNQVSKRLGVKESVLKAHIDTNNVHCIIPKWIVNTRGECLDAPSRIELWPGYVTANRKRKRDANLKDGGVIAVESTKKRFTSNDKIAELFRQLSNLHQSCPLLTSDAWKSYTLRINAGRIMNLNFEISDDPDTLARLKAVKGIGSGSIDKINEYFSTGSLSRIREFQTDPKRVAMKNMMDIWGVGRVKALELVHKGYKKIQDVRVGIEKKKLFLERNQLVGVCCYEDIIEEMTRHEVETIGKIVEQHTQQLYPGAEVQIMGSYRRGKTGCGDVDVHITHKSFEKKLPTDALGKVVNILWESGHIAFHLTFLSGMKTGLNSRDFQDSGHSIPNHAWELSMGTGDVSTGEKSSSYMGVFNSPVETGKRRRVDIKLYPYRERIFASLYFTGNGFFNRSMRLWAKRRFNYRLNDHGLFVSGTNDRVMKAFKERDVFEKLQLVYKEPWERDCFDAVEPIEQNEFTELEMTEYEVKKDDLHIWVH